MRLPASVAPLAAASLAAAAAPAQEPATVPAALAAELVDAGQPLRATEPPTIVVGRLPDGFPAVPLPAGGRVLGGAVWRAGNVVALVEVNAPPPQARAQALAALDAAGWKAPPSFGTPDPDYPQFRSSPFPDPERDATRCAPGDSSTAVVVGARARDGRAIVRLLALRASRPSRCRSAQPARRLTAERGSRPPVPALPAPIGVRIQPESGSELGRFEVGASARALADSATGAPPNSAAVLAHYARVLASGGWTAVSVAGWDTTRATPLFVSPPDSTGARWVAAVSARPDSTVAAGAGGRTTSPALALQLRVAQVGAGAPSGWTGVITGSATYLSSSSTSDGSASELALTRRDSARTRPRPAGPPVQRELVEALLGGPFFGADDDRVGERLTDGRPPAGWSAPVPDLAGARVLGGWKMRSAGERFGDWGMLAVTAPGAPADVAAAYERQLDRAGWRRQGSDGTPGGTPLAAGFLTSTTGVRVRRPASASFSRCAPDGQGYLSAFVAERTVRTGSLLRLTLMRGLEGALCAAPGRDEAAVLRAQYPPLAPLAAPAGFRVQGGQGGGGALDWRMSATVRGAASPAAVVAAYAAELRATGWTVDSAAFSPSLAAAPVRRTVPAAADSGAPGASDRVAAMSRMFAGPQEWNGLLTAVRRADGVYSVALEVRRAFGQER